MRSWTVSDTVMLMVTGNYVLDAVVSSLVKIESVAAHLLTTCQVLVALASAAYIGYKIWALRRTELRAGVVFQEGLDEKERKKNLRKRTSRGSGRRGSHSRK